MAFTEVFKYAMAQKNNKLAILSMLYYSHTYKFMKSQYVVMQVFKLIYNLVQNL